MRAAIFSLIACIALCGCAQVPPQSAALSATLGRDLLEVQRSHRKAVDLLHDRDIERVNNYMAQVVTPFYVREVLNKIGPRLSADIARAADPDAPQADKDKAFDEMKLVVAGITSRIEKQRHEFTSVIEASRKERLHELDMAYAQMQKANAILTAHIQSVVKVHTEQDELLAKAGLKDFRAKVGDAALEANAEVEKALKGEDNIEEALNKLKKALSKTDTSK